jgi:hypothetical protein
MLKKDKIHSAISCLLLLFVMTAAAQRGWAQSVPGNEEKIPLRTEQFKINRLASNQSNDQAVFTVDSATLIYIEIISNIGTIQTSIVLPSGTAVTPATINSIGGKFVKTNAAASSGLSISPSLTGNFHYVYSFPAQGAGNYTVRFQAPSGLSQEVAILTNAIWDSPVTAKVFAPESVVKVGSPTVLTAALFKGAQAITGATVQVTIKDRAGNKTTLNLLDDGAADTDDKAGDGLYSGEFTPQTAGRHSILAKLTGTAPGGPSFVRHSLTELNAVAPKGQLSGVVTNRGVDDNGDGLTDRVAFSVGAQINTAGTYQAFVHIRTRRGKTIVGSGTAALTSGSGLIEANVPADAIRRVNENGPYTIELVELDFLDPAQGSESADRRRNLGQTATYLVSQFQRRPLILTGAFTEQGVDTNGNGKFG